MGTKKTQKAEVEQQGLHIGGVFPYAGGKRKERDLGCFAPILLKGGPFDTLADVFAGSASISLFLAQFVAPKLLWLNDLNPSVYAAHLAVRDHIDELVERVKELGETTREPKKAAKLWYSLRKELRAERLEVPETKEAIVKLAAKKVYFQHLGWNQNGDGSRGVSSKEIARWDSRVWLGLQRVHDILATIPEVKVTCLDYQEVLDTLGPDDLAYLDPPYVERGKDFYRDDFSGDDSHEKLRDRLKEASFRWVLTYGDANEVGDLYDWASTFKTNQFIERHSGSTLKYERIITPPTYPEGLTIGDRTFDLDWPQRPFETKDGWDFERVRAFKRHFQSRKIERDILVDGDDVIIDGRNRLLAAFCAGTSLDDVPIRRLVHRPTTPKERQGFRLMLQGTHKGMTPLEKGEIVYGLYYDDGMKLCEIERAFAIPTSTASNCRRKWEDHLAKPFLEEYDKEDEFERSKLGSDIDLARRCHDKFEAAAKVIGKKRAHEAAIWLFVDWWESVPETQRNRLSTKKERDEALTKALCKHMGVSEEDGPVFKLGTVSSVTSGPPRWVIDNLVEVVGAMIDHDESRAA